MTQFKTDLIHFGYLNKNDRIYKESNIDLNELNNGTILGEIDHPSRFEVNLGNVSHRITNFKIHRGALYGDVEILATPKGRVLEELMKSNGIVFRPRGSGTINQNGTINNYKVYTFDAILATDDPFNNAMLRRCKIEKIIDNIRKNENIL